MAELKTKLTTQNPIEFLQTIEPASKRADGLKLLEMFEKATAETARMWGSSIVGFGTYHYKSERSAQEGDWPLVGFSPRKQSLTLYIISGDHTYGGLLDKLGKFKTSAGCLYINKLADVDQQVLPEVIKAAYLYKKSLTS